MEIHYRPNSKLEKFGEKIYFLLVENFSASFFVGGMVRDLLLLRPVTDIDIATVATPDQIINILQKHHISYNESGKKYGVIKAILGEKSIEIATFRKDIYKASRYPQITFVKTPKADSQRRDFTINSLYLRVKNNKILDFYSGIKDLKNCKIKFIGFAEKRVKEDPLRIIRALRFALMLDFSLEKNTAEALKKHFNLIRALTKSKINTELLKLKSKTQRKILQTVIDKPKMLDKYFKMS